MVNLTSFLDRLIVEEDLKLMPYPDTEGCLTIGIGRNLTANGISREEAIYLANNDIRKAFNDCYKAFTWFHFLDDVRQEVILDMTFNMGIGSLAGFRKMLSAVAIKDYDLASVEMLHSKWAVQVGNRALKLAHMMQTGTR